MKLFTSSSCGEIVSLSISSIFSGVSFELHMRQLFLFGLEKEVLMNFLNFL